MTQIPTEVSLLEQMARAICEAHERCDPDEVVLKAWGPRWKTYLEPAKAAARVLLTAEPSGCGVDNALIKYTLRKDGTSPQALVDISGAIKAHNAERLREIENG